MGLVDVRGAAATAQAAPVVAQVGAAQSTERRAPKDGPEQCDDGVNDGSYLLATWTRPLMDAFKSAV